MANGGMVTVTSHTRSRAARFLIGFGSLVLLAAAVLHSFAYRLRSKLTVQRGIVDQKVDDVKTDGSHRTMPIDADVLEIMKVWKQKSQFSQPDDWMFASPVKIGLLPVSYPWIWKSFQNAAAKAGIGSVGTHTMRHTYRSWLDSVGTPVGVQQKLLRHSDIRTTMNVYGDAFTDDMAKANHKVSRMALAGAI
jgi:integrase